MTLSEYTSYRYIIQTGAYLSIMLLDLKQPRLYVSYRFCCQGCARLSNDNDGCLEVMIYRFLDLGLMFSDIGRVGADSDKSSNRQQ
jgi:hypothetical protein